MIASQAAHQSPAEIMKATRKRSRKKSTGANLIGAAGEHHVLCQLLLHGYIAALAPRGVPNTDIVVSDVQSTRLFSVQVKARQKKGTDGGWHMGAKHERLVSPTLFYAFVDFGDVGVSHPRTWVLPSALVAQSLFENAANLQYAASQISIYPLYIASLADYQTGSQVIAETHRAYIALPGAKGPRRDTDFRRLLPDYTIRVPQTVYGVGWMDRHHVPWPMLGATIDVQTANALLNDGIVADCQPT